MKNEYEVRGNVTAIFIESREFGRVECLIDTEDLPRVQAIEGAWRLQNSCVNQLYVGADINGTFTPLGRFITDAGLGQTVRYKDDNGFDNRRCNLRVIDRKKKFQL